MSNAQTKLHIIALSMPAVFRHQRRCSRVQDQLFPSDYASRARFADGKQFSEPIEQETENYYPDLAEPLGVGFGVLNRKFPLPLISN